MTLRRYGTPAAFKQSLEQRLRDAARDAGLELARFRQLLVFDRFLARAAQVFGEALILKGGLVLELRLERARSTRDIDLRLMGNPSDTLSRLQAAGRLELGDHLRFTVRPDSQQPTIQAEGLRYEGLRYRAQADLAGKVYGAAFGIDVAFAEPLIVLRSSSPDGRSWSSRASSRRDSGCTRSRRTSRRSSMPILCPASGPTPG